jgi:chromosomal replication initiation ATPase DnaA
MPREAPRQFPLDLPVETRFGAEDFLVASHSADAHRLTMGWPRWPDRILLLVGPEGSGKSHLGAIWRHEAGAHGARDVDDALAATLSSEEPAVFLDDGDRADETALFHLLNAMRERRGFLLLAARTTPTLLWPELPDLASRLRALPVARLAPPDEATVTAVLVKLLDDRQLRVETGVVEFLARRAERSLGAVRSLVAALDRESLARGRAVGRGLAADVLARMEAEGD